MTGKKNLVKLPPFSSLQRVQKDVVNLRIFFVNVQFIGNKSGWVLVDTGYRPGNAALIIKVASALFGHDHPPRAILLTHAHFDHAGGLNKLVEHWKVPVYLHPLEVPFLTGYSIYPPPDSTVGGGAMASIFSRLFPRSTWKFGGSLNSYPADHHIPELPGWEVFHTPGHAPGHVSFFREDDGLLIAGDAFVTTNQESMWNSMFAPVKQIHRPPAYFTPDWDSALKSVRELARLKPRVVVTGHGLPMRGPKMLGALTRLAKNFQVQIPAESRYAKVPARFDQSGVVYIPPPVADPVRSLLAIGGVLLIAGLGVLVWPHLGSSRKKLS